MGAITKQLGKEREEKDVEEENFKKEKKYFNHETRTEYHKNGHIEDKKKQLKIKNCMREKILIKH